MSTDTSLPVQSHEESWLPVLELAIEEVFEIMVGQRVKPAPTTESHSRGGFTAMVGIAGALCGILTISCDKKMAFEIAKYMLGPEIGEAEDQVSDALGEVCNMIAGNFESGSARMKPTSQATFDRIADLLRKRGCNIRVEGHTDNVPIHTTQFESNWELSASRSTEIVRLLIVRNGYPPEQLSTAGYAEFHPVASNATAEGRASNRRVDIVVLRQELPPAMDASQLPSPRLKAATPVTNRTPMQKPSAVIGPKPNASPAAVRPK